MYSFVSVFANFTFLIKGNVEKVLSQFDQGRTQERISLRGHLGAHFGTQSWRAFEESVLGVIWRVILGGSLGPGVVVGVSILRVTMGTLRASSEYSNDHPWVLEVIWKVILQVSPRS